MSVLKGEGKVPILFGSTSISVGSNLLTGYLARPDLAGEWPTVIVVPSIWGVTSAKDLCRQLARWGFAAIAPDLYRGKAPSPGVDREEAVEAAEAVPTERAWGDLRNVLLFITNPAGSWSSAERGYGVLGIGAGGPLAVKLATATDASAIGLVHSPLSDDTIDRLAETPVPVLGLYGRNDEAIPVDDVVAAHARIPHAEIALYEGVGQDFIDDLRDGYDRVAAVDARERLVDFYTKHLPAAPSK